MNPTLDMNDIINQLKEKTKENFKSLVEEGTLFSEDKFEKKYIQNHPMEYKANSSKKPIPLNIIYHSLYDQDNLCQSSNGKLNFQRHGLSIKNDYDIVYDKKTFNNNNTPKYFKIPLAQCVSSLLENKSIKDEINDLDNYPKVLEFKYVYQHPIPNPVLFGPKLLKNTDLYKIIFISPICLIIEQKGSSEGFSGIDCFYSAIRFRFDMELNQDLTIKKTLLNTNFGINFTKSNWLQGKIKSSALSQAEEGFTTKFLPSISKELDLTIKKYSKNLNKVNKIELKDKRISRTDKSFTLDDIIINDSFISDIGEEIKNENQNVQVSSKNNVINNFNFNMILIILGIFACVLAIKFIDKEYIMIFLLGVIAFNLFSINSKLDKLCEDKKL